MARKIVRKVKRNPAKAEANVAKRKVMFGSRKVDWDAPGMPPPGPNFLTMAQHYADGSGVVKTKVKNPETGKQKTVSSFELGPKLISLYDKALKTPGFELPIEIRGGNKKHVEFICGHIWGQHSKAFAQGIEKAVDGPRPADVMILGKMPGVNEVAERRNMVGESGELLLSVLRDLKIKGMNSWYVTNLCKFRPPDGSTRLRAAWIKDCWPLLQQELRIVRPKYILCLGADASKELLGKRMNVSYMEGRVAELEYPINQTQREAGEDLVMHKSLVMTVIHPASVVRDSSDRRRLERGLARFNLLKSGKRFDLQEKNLDHRKITTLEELVDYIYEVENDPRKKDNVVGVDAEWNGEHPVNKGSYVRTVQFSHLPKCGCAVVLNAPGGKPCFVNQHGKNATKSAMRLLTKYFNGGTIKLRDGRTIKCKKKRVVGHFFNADLEWLIDIGLDIRPAFEVPLYPTKVSKLPKAIRGKLRKWGFEDDAVIPPFVLTKLMGGADTGLMAHAIEETASYPLESLLLRYTEVPRYDILLQDWKVAYCKAEGIKAKDMEGYGMCPDEVLVPYGIYDADGTLRLYYELEKLLDSDYEGNNCREAFWEAMAAAPSVLEIHRNGIAVDKKRIDDLSCVFVDAKQRQEKTIKDWARWPTFNVRSVQQVREFLFGERYNGKVTKDGNIVRIRPRAGDEYKDADGVVRTAKADGRTLNIEPFLDTSKPPRLWTEVVDKGLERERNPGTGKAILAILAQENLDEQEQIQWVRDYRFLDQVLKSVLRPPMVREDGSWITEDSVESPEEEAGLLYTSFGGGLGGLIYEKGLASQICSDGRVRTHIYQTKETGRWASARPNLQNMSKARDPDYLRMLGKKAYKHKLRSILMASPGHVLIEADFIGAELYGMAVMSGDTQMIEHCQRNQLPDHDPKFYDIHSNVAVFAFGMRVPDMLLDPEVAEKLEVPAGTTVGEVLGLAVGDPLPANKLALKLIKKSHLRIVAKSVIFGIAYGRGAKAIALAAKEQGVHVTVEEAQRVIDAIYQMYPRLEPFFADCKERALEHGWLQNCFGRYRRFPRATDSKMQGEFERQAMNFPIQSMIASAMNRSMAYIYDYKTNVEPDLYRILLQIHDAVLLEVPYANVAQVVDHVLPLTMREMVPIYPTTLDGRPTGNGPYHLGIDCEVMTHWGEHLTAAFCNQHGIPLITPGGVKIAV